MGDTDFYGPDFGLGMVASANPAKVTLTNACATAQILGYEYGEASLASPPSQLRATEHAAMSTAEKCSQRGRASLDKLAAIQRVQARAR